MEDEYKVVCALSNGAIFDDLVTPNLSFKVTVYLKGEYLANGASDPLLGFSGSADRMAHLQFDKIQDSG